MKSRIMGLAAPLTAVALLAAAPAASAASYIVLGKSAGSLDAKLRSAGGTVVASMPEVGVFVVESDSPNFKSRASRIGGVSAVAPDVMLRYDLPTSLEAGPTLGEATSPPFTGDDDFFFDLQWGHDAVDATEAWEAGYRGAGATVAILDGGFDIDHPDLVPNLGPGGTAWECHANFSADPSIEYGYPDPFSHGTHTAGTVGAADNAFGSIGVAPEATLCLVKVLGDAGSGSFSWLIQGLYHISNPAFGVDVANMSLGAYLPRSTTTDFFCDDDGNCEKVLARDIAALVTAVQRIAQYATHNGITLIASAGNDGQDGDKDKDFLHIPSDVAHVTSISATGPFLWAADPANAYLDWPAIYTHYGRSDIDFAAPGGDYYGAFFDEGYAPCTIAGLTRPCYVFDFVFSTGNGGWYWSVGTSMASPHAAGVAAIIVGKNGGSMNPSHVLREMRAGADDLYQPGKDKFYGMGRVNANGSVQ